MNSETKRKLTEMNLRGVIEAYESQEKNDFGDMSFDHRFQLLVDHEYSRRQSNRLARLIRQAKFVEPNALLKKLSITMTAS